MLRFLDEDLSGERRENALVALVPETAPDHAEVFHDAGSELVRGCVQLLRDAGLTVRAPIEFVRDAAPRAARYRYRTNDDRSFSRLNGLPELGELSHRPSGRRRDYGCTDGRDQREGGKAPLPAIRPTTIAKSLRLMQRCRTRCRGTSGGGRDG